MRASHGRLLLMLNVECAVKFIFLLLGKPLVVVGTPEAAAKMYRAEGKYPSRGGGENKIIWILEKNKIPNSIGFS